MEWYNTYGGEGTDYGRTVVQTFDGGYLIGGTTLSYNAGSYPQDMYLVKTDSLGGFEWHKTYGNPSINDPPIKDLIKTADGNYVFTGALSIYYDSGTGLQYKEARIIKIDESGNTIWDKQYAIYDDYYEPIDTTYVILYSVKETEDGRFAGVGYFQVWVNQVARGRGLMFMFNSEGDTLWTRKYTCDFDNGMYGGLLQIIDLTDDGGFILGGRVDSDEQTPYQKIWLVKVDSLGYDYPDFIDEVLKEEGIAVYPNPSDGIFNIRSNDLSLFRNSAIEVYDLMGRQYKISNPNDNTTHLQINLSELHPGIYLLRLLHDDEVVGSVKVVKQ